MSDSLAGQFLIAGKRLRDPNFHKSVVLVVEHGDDGAMGLIVNRPSSVTVAHALAGHFDLPETDDLVYVGGPVDPSALFVLHNDAGLDEVDSAVISGVHVGSSPEVFERVVRSSAEGDPDMKFRIFSGCAGWGPGQLESEVSRGDWHQLPATAELTFHEDPYEIWDILVRKLSESTGILPDSPADPEWN